MKALEEGIPTGDHLTNDASADTPAVSDVWLGDDKLADDFNASTPATVNAGDQLPNVEEYRASLAAENPPKQQRKWYLIALVSFVFLGLCGIFIGIGVAVSKEKTADEYGDDYYGDDIFNDDAFANKDDKKVFFIENFEKFLVNKKISSEEDLAKMGSPQFAALDWITSEVQDSDEQPEGQVINADGMEELKERYILAVFFMATEGSQWNHDGADFVSKKHVCEWHDTWVNTKNGAYNGEGDNDNPEKEKTRVGVSCNGSQKVQSIFLPYMNLAGAIPSEIGYLNSLTTLTLAGNRIRGEMPQSLARLTKLQDLILYDNDDLQGKLPEWLPRLTSLQHLHLAGTSMEGSLPAKMNGLKNLEFINFEGTDVDGNLNNLKDMPKLKGIFLNNCELTEGITAELLDGWPNLEVLDLGLNEIKGTLPHDLFLHRQLRVIDLSDNFLTGSIPSSTWGPQDDGMSKLESLNLKSNELQGTIPTELGKLTELSRLDLSWNTNIVGDLPGEQLGHLEQLEYLFLSNLPKLNPGPISPKLGSLAMLKDLSLKNTNRNGDIPPSFELLQNLILLDLSNNQLSGPNLYVLGTIRSLRFLFFNGNQYQGKIPILFGNLDNLVKLHTQDNLFADFHPSDCDTTFPQYNKKPLDEFVANCKPETEEQKCVTQCCSIFPNNASSTCADQVYSRDTSSQEPAWNNPLKRLKYTFRGQQYSMKTLDLISDDNQNNKNGDFETLQANMKPNSAKNKFGWKQDIDDGYDDQYDDDNDIDQETGQEGDDKNEGEWIKDDDDNENNSEINELTENAEAEKELEMEVDNLKAKMEAQKQANEALMKEILENEEAQKQAQKEAWKEEDEIESNQNEINKSQEINMQMKMESENEEAKIQAGLEAEEKAKMEAEKKAEIEAENEVLESDLETEVEDEMDDYDYDNATGIGR